MGKVTPKAKIICVYREPVERLWSHYKFSSKIKGLEEAGATLPALVEKVKENDASDMWNAADNMASALDNGQTCVMPPEFPSFVMANSYIRAGEYDAVAEAFYKRFP